jgi:hypothetical protein
MMFSVLHKLSQRMRWQAFLLRKPGPSALDALPLCTGRGRQSNVCMISNVVQLRLSKTQFSMLSHRSISALRLKNDAHFDTLVAAAQHNIAYVLSTV